MWLRICSLLFVIDLLGINRKGGASKILTKRTQNETTNEQVSVKLLYGESNGIFWTDLQSQDRLDPLLYQQDLKVLGLDYHYQRRALYFSSWGNIWRLQLDAQMKRVGEPTIFVEDAPGVTSLAVDWVNDRLYWVSPSESFVWRVDLTGSNKTAVINDTEPIYGVNNLVLDPYQGLLFLALDGSGFLRASLEGDDQWMAEVKSDEYMTGVTLAIDVSRMRLYISGGQDYLPRLTSCRYDGNDLIEYDLTDKWWNNFLSIGVFSDQVFWAVHQEVDRFSVFKANMTTNGKITYELEYRTDAQDPDTKIWAIKVFHPELQTLGQTEEIMTYEYKSNALPKHYKTNSLLHICVILLFIARSFWKL